MLAPEARQAENVRKMVLAMVNDVRVVVVKLADRLHNMRTIQYLEPAKQQRIARETLEIYSPIAHRLGMGIIRNELEDLSFRVLEPDSFLALQKEVTEKQPIHQKFLEEVQAAIRSKLVENGIPAELEARVKGLCSLHRKLQRRLYWLWRRGLGLRSQSSLQGRNLRLQRLDALLHRLKLRVDVVR